MIPDALRYLDENKHRLQISTQKLGQWLVWLVIVGPAIFDWLHGLLVTELGIGVMASMYRASIMALGLVLLFFRPRWPIVLMMLFYLAFLVFEFFTWSAYSQVYVGAELISSANILFLPLCYILLSFTIRYMGVSREYFIQQVIVYGKITAAVVVVSLVFGIGIPTYLSSAGILYGFGTQSYYVAGNVLGLTMVVPLAISLYRLVKDFNRQFFFDSLLIFAGAFCVGSRTGMAISLLLMALAVFYFILLASGQYRYRAAVAIFFVPLLIFGAIKSYELISQYSRMASKLELLLEGQVRNEHSESAWRYLETKRKANKMTGSSYQVYIREFANFTPKRWAPTATAETDPVDVIGAYGLVGLIVLYFPYAFCIFISGLNALLYRSPIAMMSFISLSMLAGHSVFAGHVLFSSKTTQFASIFLVLALTRPRSIQTPHRQRVAYV